MSFNRQRTDTKPWYKQFWPWFVMLFPATAVVAGISTVVIAVKSDDGLVESEYYKKGLLINFSKEMDHRASELNMSGYARFDPKAGELYVLLEALPEGNEPAELNVRLKHATRADMDQELSVTATSSKEFRSDLGELSPGKWHVIVEMPEQWRLSGTIAYPTVFDTQLSPAVY
ncbi:FixH family protein [Granulosicoccaceae sp. 1_MG-2023]|nr:FixH family protein [Granulosicoccaceae sp. 1_MG-2023]